MKGKLKRLLESFKSFTSSDRAVRMKRREGQRIERVVTLYLKVVGKRKDVKVHVTSIICDIGEFPCIEIHCEDFCAELNYGSQYMFTNIEAEEVKDQQAVNIIEMLYNICEDVLSEKTKPSLLLKNRSLNIKRNECVPSFFPNSWVIMNGYK